MSIQLAPIAIFFRSVLIDPSVIAPEKLIRCAKVEDNIVCLSGRGAGANALYAIEAEIRGRPPVEGGAIRQARAGPLLDSMREWLRHTIEKASKKSELATAIGYILTRRKALTRYRDSGLIEIDNNAAERALRVVALGRSYANPGVM